MSKPPLSKRPNGAGPWIVAGVCTLIAAPILAIFHLHGAALGVFLVVVLFIVLGMMSGTHKTPPRKPEHPKGDPNRPTY